MTLNTEPKWEGDVASKFTVASGFVVVAPMNRCTDTEGDQLYNYVRVTDKEGDTLSIFEPEFFQKFTFLSFDDLISLDS